MNKNVNLYLIDIFLKQINLMFPVFDLELEHILDIQDRISFLELHEVQNDL